jgi:lipopolysaccharide export system permease protein
VSLYFQNVVGPDATLKLRTLLISMRQKSPELDIPEGIFYNEIPGYNLFVQQKDKQSGMLHGVMIYMNNENFEDAQIVLADSALLRMTRDRKHLLLTLYSGERFRNMQSQGGVSAYANVPYMRETFMKETDLIDFDADFNMMDASLLSNSATSKNMKEIRHSIDSLDATYDSIGRSYYKDVRQTIYAGAKVDKKDSVRAVRRVMAGNVSLDTAFEHLPTDAKLDVMNRAIQKVQFATSDLNYKQLITSDGDKDIRAHWIQWHQKITLSLSCIIFFFIGAPLGAIIRKGGLGLPVIISVGIFIFYYIIDFSGMKMAKAGEWQVWFGMWISSAVLTPMAVFFTYKSNNDSIVFNFDLYRTALRKALGLRNTRQLFLKEVIISPPDYEACYLKLKKIREACKEYTRQSRLKQAPNYWRLFFRYQKDQKVEAINEFMESTIEELSNSRNKHLIAQLNHFPVIAVKAHTRPFDRKWINISIGILFPVGLLFYLRMSRFRWRLYRDLRLIRHTCFETEDTIRGEIFGQQPITTHTTQGNYSEGHTA